VARRKFWDLYEDCEHLEPEVGAIPFDQQDAHSKRLYLANDYRNFDITPEDIRRSRRAYFANISYLDAKIGGIIDVLNRCRMADDTIVVFVSDHGDMLGERGLWFKMSFFEGSARVPLMIAAPGLEPRRVDAPVSTVDVTPTLADLAGVPMDEIMPWTDGESLLGLAKGGQRTAPVAIEYAAEGSYAPLVSLRYGKWKYNRCALDPDQLFDLEADPHEMTDLAGEPAHQGTLDALRAKSEARWDLDVYDGEVRQSQARRWVVYEALRNGAYYPWDFQPLQKASERYMRNHMDLNTLEENQRFPRGE
jgi:choline-sulfatase